MKKVLVVLGIVAFGFAFTSCKKECKCSVAGVNMPLSGKVIETKADCDEYAKLYSESGSAMKC